VGRHAVRRLAHACPQNLALSGRNVHGRQFGAPVLFGEKITPEGRGLRRPRPGAADPTCPEVSGTESFLNRTGSRMGAVPWRERGGFVSGGMKSS